jgi:hypothetical protein
MVEQHVMRNISPYEMALQGSAVGENYQYQAGTIDDDFPRNDGGNPYYRWMRNRPVEQLVRGLLYSFQSFTKPQYFQRIFGYTDAQSRQGISLDTRLTSINFNTQPLGVFGYHVDQNMTPDEVAVWMTGGR